MAEQQTNGIFLVHNLPHEGKEIPDAYCRVVGAEVVTAQAQALSRVLTYRIGFWDHVPNIDETPRIFHCSVTNQDSFARKIAVSVLLEAQGVQSQAIEHFLSLVLCLRPIRDAAETVAELVAGNHSPWSFLGDDNSMAFSLSNVLHHQAFRAIDGEDLAALYETVSYTAKMSSCRATQMDWQRVRPQDLPRLEFTAPYVDQISLVEGAAAHFQLPETQAVFIENVRKQLAGK